jgi:hypothetical protein
MVSSRISVDSFVGPNLIFFVNSFDKFWKKLCEQGDLMLYH